MEMEKNNLFVCINEEQLMSITGGDMRTEVTGIFETFAKWLGKIIS